MTIIKRLVFILFVLFFGGSVLTTLLYKWLPVPLTPLMLIRGVQQVRAGETWKIEHRWVSLDEMSIYMPVAVIASEDQRFMQHNGFDLEAIGSAMRERMEGGRMRGGSTISQQTAKNVFLWPQSSWLRKGLEVYFTFLIETLWSKERIMEVYLNSIEMGPGIYGVEAVAREHFGCDAKSLTRSQCALIAATLPNPLRFSSKYPDAFMRRREEWIKRQMKHVPLLQREVDESFDNDRHSDESRSTR